jgi:predicted RNA-binding Zn ribbon-like protein
MPNKTIFDAGSPALTFANMAGAAGGEDYAELVEAFRRGRLIDGPRADQLLGQAPAAPLRAAETLAEARILARVLQRIFAALAKRTAPATADIDFLNGSLGSAMAHLSLAPLIPSPETPGSGPGFGWTWQGNGSEAGSSQPGAILWPLLREAAELLVTGDPARIRQCQGAGCRRLFLDTSKAGRRRWCNMQTCGNRAKARRHAERHSPASS